ncbi:uncharacterized protein LOC121731206 [Aricia agestis]|uniref:uncharacterized protein LOC121731206 n=1 Tax=Aricia agestis TaxID=91739 RepID=UPI001C207F04|nr:uncharacterized protein LOC121731206 [Aricia agestis]
MSACVVEEGREEGGGVDEVPERPRREVLLSARGRRACSEQGPHAPHLQSHGTSHLWGSNSSKKGWSRKRTSAPQMGNTQGSMPRLGLVLRSRRSWPVAPQSYRRKYALSQQETQRHISAMNDLLEVTRYNEERVYSLLRVNGSSDKAEGTY